MLSIKIIYTISFIELGLQMDAFIFNSGILLREVQRRLRLISVCLVTWLNHRLREESDFTAKMISRSCELGVLHWLVASHPMFLLFSNKCACFWVSESITHLAWGVPCPPWDLFLSEFLRNQFVVPVRTIVRLQLLSQSRHLLGRHCELSSHDLPLFQTEVVYLAETIVSRNASSILNSHFLIILLRSFHLFFDGEGVPRVFWRIWNSYFLSWACIASLCAITDNVYYNVRK